MQRINLNNVAQLSKCDFVCNLVLVANTGKDFDLQRAGAEGATHVVISSVAGGVFVRTDGNTAAVPGADVLDGTGGMVDPVVLDLSAITKLSFASATAQVVSLAFYRGR